MCRMWRPMGRRRRRPPGQVGHWAPIPVRGRGVGLPGSMRILVVERPEAVGGAAAAVHVGRQPLPPSSHQGSACAQSGYVANPDPLGTEVHSETETNSNR